MEELYQLIEAKIKSSGYPKTISGFDVYNEISNEIEQKEIGTYIFLCKKEDSILYEYKVDVMEEEFNLSYLHITDNGIEYHINFDD